MDKKVLIAIIAVLVVVIIGVGAFVLFGKNETPQTKAFDVETANTTLSGMLPFTELATMNVTKEAGTPDLTAENAEPEAGLDTIYSINPENVEKVYGKLPMMMTQASQYLLLQAKEGTVDTVKAELDAYLTRYEQQWSRYLPEQYDLVMNRKVGVIGNNIYLIIASNAAELEQAITK